MPRKWLAHTILCAVTVKQGFALPECIASFCPSRLFLSFYTFIYALCAGNTAKSECQADATFSIHAYAHLPALY